MIEAMTAALVLITAFYAWATYRILQANESMVRAARHAALVEDARRTLVGRLRADALALELQTLLQYIDAFLAGDYNPAVAQAYVLTQDLRARLSAADADIHDTETSRILWSLRSTLDQFTVHLGPDWRNPPPEFRQRTSLSGGLGEARGLKQLTQRMLDSASATYQNLLQGKP